LNYLDYIIFLVILIGFLLGFKDGLVRKIIGLAGLIIGIALAFQFSGRLGQILIGLLNNDEYLSNLVAGILIFLAVVLIATILKRIIHPFDKVNRMINQFLGGVIGAIQITFFLSAVFLFLNVFGIPKTEQRNSSFSYNFVLDLIPKSVDLVMGKSSKAADYIKQYIEKNDSEQTPPIDTLKHKK
jgi:membrane protein required for colicin V production